MATAGFGMKISSLANFSTHRAADVQMARVRASHARSRAMGRAGTPREMTMQYILLIYADEKKWNAMPDAAKGRAMQGYMAYGEALRKAGAYVGSDRLRDVSDATTVTVTGGKTQVMDGPFADTKEQLGGYYIVEAKDLDEA